jgi:hypothetical protein
MHKYFHLLAGDVILITDNTKKNYPVYDFLQFCIVEENNFLHS